MNFLGTLNGKNTLGQDIGESIGQGLQSLAHNKINQQQIKHKQQFLSSIGLRPEVANSLAHRDDKFIGDFLKQLEGLEVGNQTQQNPQGYQQALGGLINNTDQNQAINSQYNNEQQSPEIQQLVARAYADHPGLEQQVSPEQLGNMFAQQMQQNQQFDNQIGIPKQGGIRTKGNRNIAQEQLAYNMQRDIEKFERPALEAAFKEYQAAVNNDKILKRERELVQKGDLPYGVVASVVDKLNKGVFGLGIDLSSLLSADAQEFQKLSAEMANNLRQAGGGRITNFMMENFLKSIPTLMQSDEGKKRVIENYQLFNDIKKNNYLTMRHLINENGGVTPKNLMFNATQLAEKNLQKYEPALDKFEKEFSQRKQRYEFKTAKDAREFAKKHKISAFSAYSGKQYKV